MRCDLRAWKAGALAAALVALPPGSHAQPTSQTSAVLEENAQGRAGANRHRLHLRERTAANDSRLFVVSCRVAEPEVIGVAIDLARKAPWPEASVTVMFERTDGVQRTERMATSEQYLTSNGPAAIDLLRWALGSRSFQFAVRDGVRVLYNLEAAGVSDRVARFRSLCGI